MKSKPNREEQRPPLSVPLALLLVIAFVATTPLAVSKYVATGTGSAGARVAKWDPKATVTGNHTILFRNDRNGDITTAAIGYTYDNSTTETAATYQPLAEIKVGDAVMGVFNGPRAIKTLAPLEAPSATTESITWKRDYAFHDPAFNGALALSGPDYYNTSDWVLNWGSYDALALELTYRVTGANPQLGLELNDGQYFIMNPSGAMFSVGTNRQTSNVGDAFSPGEHKIRYDYRQGSFTVYVDGVLLLCVTDLPGVPLTWIKTTFWTGVPYFYRDIEYKDHKAYNIGQVVSVNKRLIWQQDFSRVFDDWPIAGPWIVYKGGHNPPNATGKGNGFLTAGWGDEPGNASLWSYNERFRPFFPSNFTALGAADPWSAIGNSTDWANPGTQQIGGLTPGNPVWLVGDTRTDATGLRTACFANPLGTDSSWELEFDFKFGAGGGYLGFIPCYINDNNYYKCVINRIGNAELRHYTSGLSTLDGGASYTTLSTRPESQTGIGNLAPSGDNNPWHHMRVVSYEKGFMLYIDGKSVFPLTSIDASSASYSIGFQGAHTVVALDNFAMYDYYSQPPPCYHRAEFVAQIKVDQVD